MMSQGWQYSKKMFFWVLIQAGMASLANASSLTVRDIQFTGKNKIEISLDGVAPKTNLEMDYVRDIVQFSIQNATIYPAKIVHADLASNASAFTKVFAYQYAPNLVRVRFSVEGEALNYKGKVKWVQKGKSIVVQFPDLLPTQEKSDQSRERSLIAKVLGQDQPVKNKIEVVEEKPSHFEKQVTLGGQKSGPSVLRSFLAMAAIVGGLGLFLFYIKRKKNGVQAKRIGNSWLSDLLPNSMKKSKALIEVLGSHALGPKQSIVVIRIRGQQLVLGVTQDHVQLITQIDSDEAEMDLLEDPLVAASIGKMFGAKPVMGAPVLPVQSKVVQQGRETFDTLLKQNSKVMNAYATQSFYGESGIPVVQAKQTIQQNSVRDQIKKRLEAMR